MWQEGHTARMWRTGKIVASHEKYTKDYFTHFFRVYLTTLSVAQLVRCKMDNSEFEWKEAAVARFQALAWILHAGTEEI